jgi:hypothetical protein
MKLSEFEEKLTTVSDSKLRRMLADSRKHGPEVAVKLILAEASRRGAVLEDEAEPPLPDYVRRASDGAGAPAQGTGLGSPEADLPPPPSGDPEAPATQGAWLAEEQDAGLPVFVKILLALIILGGAAGGLFYLLNKHG